MESAIRQHGVNYLQIFRHWVTHNVNDRKDVEMRLYSFILYFIQTRKFCVSMVIHHHTY